MKLPYLKSCERFIMKKSDPKTLLPELFKNKERNNSEVIKNTLISNFPDKEIRAKVINEWFLLNWAISFARVDLVDFLIKNGADVNILQPYIGSPLHCALTQVNQYLDAKHISNRQPQIVKLLIENGADVNIKMSDSGDTPLHYVYKRGAHMQPAQTEDYCKIAALLLSNGALPNVKNNQGKIPMDFKVSNIGSLDDLPIDDLIRNINENDQGSENSNDYEFCEEATLSFGRKF